MVAFLQEEDSGYAAQQVRDGSGEIVISPEPVNTYRAEIEEFSGAIIESRQPGNNAKLGLQSQKVLSACYKSAKTNTVVTVQ